MARKLIVANWKLNPDREPRAVALARRVDADAARYAKRVEVVICPPYPYLSLVRRVVRTAKLGAQDVFWEDQGAYTGMVSPTQLANLRTAWVIVGHSERRHYAGETDAVVHAKLAAALRVLLKPILCVGEPLVVRRAGMAAVKRYIGAQLRAALRGIGFPVVIAYEPIWAIGTGRADRPKDTAAVTSFIKEFIFQRFGTSPQVLYGGSVKARNAAGFLREPAVDGALVGGASLVPQEFGKIIRAAAEGHSGAAR